MSIISRITTWAAQQVLTASALNGEFNNVVNVINNVDSGTTSLTTPKVSANPVTALGIVPKQYTDNYVMYRRPVLQFSSTSVVAMETGINGSSGVARILFPDGSLRTDSTTSRIQFNTAQNAVLSGTAQGGLDTGSITNNRWYAVYAVETSDNSSNFVAVGSLTLPTQANYATLNSNLGTSGSVPAWVYLGLVRYGDNQGTANAILDFVQSGNMTFFKNSLTVSNDAVVTAGIQMAQTAGATSLTYTYAAGSGATQVPNNIGHIAWKIFGSQSSVAMYQFLDGGGTRVYGGNVGSTAAVKGAYPVLIPASEGIKVTISTSGSIEEVISGFWDGALGVGSNPIL